MIEGLEFLRSWRFWVLFIGSTSAVMFASAGVHIALALYLPALDVEPDPFFSLLGGGAVMLFASGLVWFIYRSEHREVFYPHEHRLTLLLIFGFASLLVAVAAFAGVHWMIVKPIVPDAAGNSIYAIFVFVFAFSFGQYLAMVEWETMMGQNSQPDSTATPGSS